MKSKKQRFYSILKDLFVGAKLEGKSGYVNLMNIKSSYFDKISKLIQDKIKQEVNEDERDELYDKLYTFFDNYFSDGGSIFFSSTPVYKNIYAKVYSDREDTALFWKTKDLYYVKTEVNYQSVKNLKLNEDDIFTFDFDASDLEHKKSNEKKELAFYFTGLKKDNNKFNLKFKVKYKETNSYDRLKEILKINDTNKLKSYIFENFEEIDNSFIFIEKNDIDLSKVNFKSKSKSNVKADILITNQNDVVNSVKLEPVITNIEEIIKYCKKEGLVILKEEDILKAFRIYKRQNEIDYFIHKDARAFLKEQFDLYVYQYLANDLDTIFNQERLDTIRKIKEIAYFVIDLIGKFEDEVKKIWLKPKFVLNSNYVITIDRIAEKEGSLNLVKKIFENKGINEQIKEWKELGIVDNDFNKEEVFSNGLIKGLNEKYKHLPIDTKYFNDEIKYEILSLFDNLDDELDGWLIKSENFQALNTILPKFKEKVQTIYIDPPFNTGEDFAYIDKFQDSTWLTLMENRLELAKNFLKEDGNIFLHLDRNANYYARILLNKVFNKENLMAEINWNTAGITGFNPGEKTWVKNQDIILHYAVNKDKVFFKRLHTLINPKDRNKPYEERKVKEIGWLDILKDEKGFFIERWENNKFKKEYLELNNKVIPIGMIWNDIYSFLFTQVANNESFFFRTQKPEHLIRRIMQSTTIKRDIILDFFSGLGATLTSSHKLNRRWIGIEMGEHFYTFYEDDFKKKIGLLGRLKIVLNGDQVFHVFGNIRHPQLSRNLNWQGGGFFKYYELEQFENVLRKAVYKPTSDKLENIEFNLSPKLAEEGLEIDYEKESAKYTFEKLYPDVDIPETISNLIGKKIKKITKDKVIFEDNFEVDLNNLTFEKYPFLKPLIWWE